MIKFWDLKNGKEIQKNSALKKDDIPILIIENIIFNDHHFIVFSKGFKVYIIEEYNQIMNIYSLEGHSSNITSICLGIINEQFTAYSSSTDGSLIQWKLSNGMVEKKNLIEKNYIQPIWGCCLSPNNFYLCLLMEHPSDNLFSTFSYLSKKKTKVYLYQTIENDLEKIFNLIKNIFTQGSNELPYKYPIDDLLKFLEQVPEKTIKLLFEKLDQEYNQNMNYFKLLVLILYKSNFDEIKEEMNQRLNDTRSILLFHHCSQTILNFKQISNVNTILSMCDWLLMFWSSQIMELPEQKIICFQNLKTIEEIYNIHSPDENKNLLKYVEKMIEFCQGNSIQFKEEIEYPKRIKCPYCDEGLPISLQFSKKFCSKNHPFELCVFSFEPMGHKIMKCNVCGTKSNFREKATCILCGSSMK